MLNSEGGRQLRSQIASVVLHEGQNVMVTGNGACAVFSCILFSKVSWDCSGSFLSEIIFLCAVMLRGGDGDMCEWEIHKYSHPSIHLNGRRE